MIVNVMERHVSLAYDQLKGRVPGFEDCAEHREDVIVYALNRLPARYVLSDEGKALTELALDSPQDRARIEVQVIEAMRIVAARPRMSRREMPKGG
jgi:hypothetical protein